MEAEMGFSLSRAEIDFMVNHDLRDDLCSDETRPQTLYHFTKFEALKEILGSKTFRLTSAKALNDTSEIQHGKLLVQRAIGEHKAGASANALGAKYSEFLERLSCELDGRERWPLTASFCHAEDKFHLWKMYAEDGQGVAIGFDREKLESLCLNGQAGFWAARAKRVHYGKDPLECVQTWLNGVQAYCSNDTPTIEPSRAIDLLAEIVLCACELMKDRHFRDEEEWRIAISPRETFWTLPEPPDGNEDHIKINLKVSPNPFPIREIVVGPRCDIKKVEDLISTSGLRESRICVRKSNCPMRELTSLLDCHAT